MSQGQGDSHLLLSEQWKESGVSGAVDPPVGDQVMCALVRTWEFSSAAALKERSRVTASGLLSFSTQWLAVLTTLGWYSISSSTAPRNEGESPDVLDCRRGTGTVFSLQGPGTVPTCRSPLH